MRFLLTLCCTSPLNHIAFTQHSKKKPPDQQQILYQFNWFPESRGERPNNVYTCGGTHAHIRSSKTSSIDDFTCDISLSHIPLLSIDSIDIFMHKMWWFCLQFHIIMENLKGTALLLLRKLCAVCCVTVNSIFQGLFHKDLKIKPNN